MYHMFKELLSLQVRSTQINLCYVNQLDTSIITNVIHFNFLLLPLGEIVSLCTFLFYISMQLQYLKCITIYFF